MDGNRLVQATCKECAQSFHTVTGGKCCWIHAASFTSSWVASHSQDQTVHYFSLNLNYKENKWMQNSKSTWRQKQGHPQPSRISIICLLEPGAFWPRCQTPIHQRFSFLLLCFALLLRSKKYMPLEATIWGQGEGGGERRMMMTLLHFFRLCTFYPPTQFVNNRL